MTYNQFKNRAKQEGFNLRRLRCDVPPSEKLLLFIDEVGENYEKYVLRLVKESK